MNTFVPLATCELPPQILEFAQDSGSGAPPLPRVLLQAAGCGHASRNVAWLAALFLGIALFEVALLFRLPVPEPLIVYEEVPRKTLLEDPR